MQNKEIEEDKQCLKKMKEQVSTTYYAEHYATVDRAIENILQYIDKLENKVKELGKGQHTLMQSRRKWKNRYYKEKRKSD